MNEPIKCITGNTENIAQAVKGNFVADENIQKIKQRLNDKGIDL